MNGSDDGFKPVQTGLVDMGFNHFYEDPNLSPIFDTAELIPFQTSFSEIVLNVTWAQLQATRTGGIDYSVIDTLIQQLTTQNTNNGTDIGIKIRVWGGFDAPDWIKAETGAVTITGQATVDPQYYDPRTIARVWTADYNAAWAELQSDLASHYDNQSIIRGISQTAGGTASDEPFVELSSAAPISSGASSSGPFVNQFLQVQGGGYTDAAEMLTLRAAIASYSQWSTTSLDYTINPYHLIDSGVATLDPNFALAVLQQTRNSTRLVQAGNHALANPQQSQLFFLYGQLTADAALTSAAAPNSYQTDSPDAIFRNGSGGLGSGFVDSSFTGAYANWPATVVSGAIANGGNIELWDFSGPTSAISGFTTLSASQVARLAELLAYGAAPTSSTPIDGADLGFVAPAFVTGASGTVSFTGTGAILLAAASSQTSYTVTVSSLNGGTLSVTDPSRFVSGAHIVSGATSGSSITFSGTLDQVNIVLASLSDNFSSGNDIVHISASDTGGHSAERNVGLQISSTSSSSSSSTSSSPAVYESGGILAVGGVNTVLSAATLSIGSGGRATTLLAAIKPSDYSTAVLSITTSLDILNSGTGHFTGDLSAPTISVHSGGVLSGDGSIAVSGGGFIVNSGTIEAAADFTFGLQTLEISNTVSGSGTLLIDAGATLIVDGGVAATQTVKFADNTLEQFSNAPYSPDTLLIASPSTMSGHLSGFGYSDRLILEGVTISGATVSGSTLVVDVGTSSLSYTLDTPGDLTGLVADASLFSGGVIQFVTPTSSGIAPSVTAPGSLQAAAGIAVLIPDIVINAPQPSSTISVGSTVSAIVSAAGGTLSATQVTSTSVTVSSGGHELLITGPLNYLERALATLTYTASSGTTSDTITVSAVDYAGGSTSATSVTVATDAASSQFHWKTAVSNGGFASAGNWLNSSGGSETTAPGGSNVALFGAGTFTVTGDGAVGEIIAHGQATLTGEVTAQGLSGTAAVVDSGGALILAGGGVLTAQQEAVVGATGQGLLTLMGGALELTGASSATALAIGAVNGASGTVLNYELIQAAGLVVVGNQGSGILDLYGVAATVYDGGATIGLGATGHGSATVNGGEWINSGNLTVGSAGSGSLLINGANNGITGQVMAYNVTIGAASGGQGTVQLDGGEMLIANVAATSNTLTVGSGGTADLILDNGSEVAVGVASANSATNNGRFDVGITSGGRGRVEIGDNSSILVYGNGTVGGGDGQVTVGQTADKNALLALLGSLAVAASGQISMGGTNATVRASSVSVSSGGKIAGVGTLSGDLGGNQTTNPADIVDDGTIQANGGTLLLYGNVTGSGSLSIGDNSTLIIRGSVGSGLTLSFGENSRALITDGSAFAGTITGFDSNDTLEFGNSNPDGVSWSNNVLTVDPGTGLLQLNMVGSYSPNLFSVRSNNLGGTIVTLAGGEGDVHMTTFDGVRYDFQAVGDFTAVMGIASPWGFQIRTESFPGATSITTALGAMLGEHRVTLAVGRDSVAYVDGAADTDLTVGTTQSFGGGTLSRLADNVYRLGWNTGQSVTVMNWGALFDWTVSLAASDGPGSVRGLLGSNSGAENTFQLPDGTNLGWLSDDQILGRFADAWRVAPAASLMNDPPAANLALLAQTMATNFDPGATGTTSGPVHNDNQDHADPLLAASPLHG